MFIYEDVLSDGIFNNLARQKIDFRRNNVKSLKQYQRKWHKYMSKDSSIREYLNKYVKEMIKDLGVNCSLFWYRSRVSEAWYITINIDSFHKKVRIANHDTKETLRFDSELYLSDYKSMKGVFKGILKFIDNCILEWRSRVTIDNFDTYFNLALKKRQEYDTTLKIKKNLEDQKLDYENQLKLLLDKHKVYEDAIDYLKEIIELISRKHIDHIEKLLNSAVKTIFYDKNYSIKLEISEFKNNNSLNIYLVEDTDEGEIITDIKNNGFGIQGVIGFVLQVYFIMYHKLSPILFMDEAMSTLSQQYLPYFKELVNALVKQYNFIFVLVAHDPRFIQLADYKYEIKDGEVREVM